MQTILPLQAIHRLIYFRFLAGNKLTICKSQPIQWMSILNNPFVSTKLSSLMSFRKSQPKGPFKLLLFSFVSLVVITYINEVFKQASQIPHHYIPLKMTIY